jgi:AAA+ ATPase superfamily predicted ATPase
MDPLHNPFSPGAGSPPPELAGRDAILERAKIVLARVKQRHSEKGFLFIGLRGVGKTVLLRQVEKLAKDGGYKTIFVESTENNRLATALILSIREILYALDFKERLSIEVKRAFRILRSFANGIKLKHGDIELSLLDVDPETGIADSGNLEYDLPALFEAVAEAAAARQTAIALIIDELQYLSEKELSALIMAIHRISQKNLPLILVGAGLPQLPRLAGDSKSYSERLFDFPEIGPLNKEDSAKALQEPTKKHGVVFTDEAIAKIIEHTNGYPYFIQEWGYQSWETADSSPIDINSVERATLKSIKRLDDNFFKVRFDRLTPSEKQYLRALAELNAEDRKSGNVAEKLGVAVNNASPARSSLIKKGMIYSKRYGDTEFTVPLFDQFMKRIMPNLEE